MKYLLRNTQTNVIDLVFELPIKPSPPLEVITLTDDQFKDDMLNSIFTSVDAYKPFPAWGKNETWWASNGKEWIDTRTDDTVWQMVRERRNKELQNTDWTQVVDCPLDVNKQIEWAEYRKVLRMIPETVKTAREAEKFLDNVEGPSK